MDGIVVIGAGVMGLSTAITLAEAGHRVRVVTADPLMSTTSAVAGALWEPYRADPADQVLAWARRTYATLEWLAAAPQHTGVRIVEGLKVSRADGLPAPVWADGLPQGAVAPVIEEDLPPGYRSGYRARLPLVDMPAHLTYLADRLVQAGGVIEQRRLRSLADVDSPRVVNCSGLGARNLVPDPLVRPVRGQLVVVANPGIRQWVVEAQGGERGMYIFPHNGTVILGGTAEDGRWDTEADLAAGEEIVRRCAQVYPALGSARILAHQVGLRPYRPRIRLERELLPSGAVCVHNYGHGGSGVTLSWACAADAAALLTAGT